jgi:hypothetical protein
LTRPSGAATLGRAPTLPGGPAARWQRGVTPSEVAFLALGLLLGIAAGAAIVVTIRNRPPTHAIRVTVTRDAVPRRASTLAVDALRGTSDGPAPGGPGDRRLSDRDDDASRTRVHPDGLPVVAVPILPWPAVPVTADVAGPLEPALAGSGRRASIAIHPEADPILAGLGLAPAATAQPTRRSEALLPALLAGDHRAMLRLIDAIGGPDEGGRRAWDTLLTRFVEAVRERTIDVGFVDLPMGNPFWDTFTVDQCRAIVVALESTGRRFDGRSEWADGVVPTYRDLSRALAESGIDPRRVRNWPNSLEIAELFRGAAVATAEAMARWAPTLDPDDVRLFLDHRNRGLDELWPVWDAVRVALGVGDSVVRVEPDRVI